MRALLELENVSRHFGSLQAVRSVSFSVAEGTIVGLIGPNGAGKSTLYNVIAGVLPPTRGSIRFEGKDVAGLRSHRVARRGIARTFQIPKPFKQLTVTENALVYALPHHGSLAQARAHAEQVVHEVGLGDYADAPARVLTVGLLKRLEVARALAGGPRLVLFDEIMAGLTPTEVREMTALVGTLPARGATVIWVEHVLHAIMSVAQRILVLNRGELIADGPPAAITRDPEVVKAYLGEELALA